MLFIAIDIKGLPPAPSGGGGVSTQNIDFLLFQVYFQFCFGIGFNGFKYFIQEGLAYLYRQDADVQCIALKDIGKKAAYHTTETIIINSPGGMVTSGMVMYDTIKLMKSPVSTICMGLAASMGSILLSAGVKGRRFVYPHAEIMIHQPSLGGYYQATSADIEIQANQMRKTKEIGAKILADNCGKTIEQIMKDFDRDYWMDANEALTYGIVDKIIDKL